MPPLDRISPRGEWRRSRAAGNSVRQVERCDLLADRRLPCPKLARNRRKAPTFDDAHEYLDAFEPIHPTLLREVGYHTEEWIVHAPGLIYSAIGVAAPGGYAPSTIIAA